MIILADVFEEILANPKNFLGADSVIRLSVYMQGYKAALRESGQEFDDQLFEQFCQWVPTRLKLNETISWAGKIYYMSMHDEARSIELTRDLWNQFRRDWLREESGV